MYTIAFYFWCFFKLWFYRWFNYLFSLRNWLCRLRDSYDRGVWITSSQKNACGQGLKDRQRGTTKKQNRVLTINACGITLSASSIVEPGWASENGLDITLSQIFSGHNIKSNLLPVHIVHPHQSHPVKDVSRRGQCNWGCQWRSSCN